MKYWIFSLVICLFISCNSDDDICISGEATPRMKIMFKEGNDNKITQLNQLYIDVDYGNETKNIVAQQNVDSIMIPLRVDNNPFTDVYIRTSESGSKSKIRINYTSESQYVSPACGFKKMYKNLNTELITPNPVTNVEQIQTEITNEESLHLYLIF